MGEGGAPAILRLVMSVQGRHVYYNADKIEVNVHL